MGRRNGHGLGPLASTTGTFQSASLLQILQNQRSGPDPDAVAEVVADAEAGGFGADSAAVGAACALVVALTVAVGAPVVAETVEADGGSASGPSSDGVGAVIVADAEGAALAVAFTESSTDVVAVAAVGIADGERSVPFGEGARRRKKYTAIARRAAKTKMRSTAALRCAGVSFAAAASGFSGDRVIFVGARDAAVAGFGVVSTGGGGAWLDRDGAYPAPRRFGCDSRASGIGTEGGGRSESDAASRSFCRIFGWVGTLRGSTSADRLTFFSGAVFVGSPVSGTTVGGT